MKSCRGCGEPVIGRPSQGARFCIKCVTDPVRLMARRQRDKNSLYYTLAHSYVNAAIRCGDLPPPTHLLCVDCNEPAKEYDHRDYTKPLQVQAVCRRCNQKRGRGKHAMPKAA